MNIRSFGVLPVVCVLLVLACQDKNDDDTVLLKLGNEAYSQEAYSHFSLMMRYFPSLNPQAFPFNREPITTMLETELLYRRVPSEVKKRVGKGTDDWQWRKRYYQAHLFMDNVLGRNMGISDEAIEQYYEQHKDELYKPLLKANVGDSASEGSATARDSVVYRPLAEVRDDIIKRLFITQYPPDSAFVARNFSDSVPDSAAVAQQWLSHVSERLRRRDFDFFLTRFYREYHGDEMPDSVELLVGEGKVIEPHEIEIAINWLPESERDRFSSAYGQREMAKWVMRWKIFSRKAKETGYTSNDDVTGVIDWAWKYHLVNSYIDDILLPKLREDNSVDTALCVYSYWDRNNRVEDTPDSAALAREIESKATRMLAIRLDSTIYELRKRAGVTFLQSDYTDNKALPPDSLAKIADSLRDSGQTKEAETYYRRLAGGYPFLPEGNDALVELAKLITENRDFRDAIRNYRLHLFRTSDTNKMSNDFFMIGFVYDEHLNTPELAEVNYKWVLEHTPACDWADDAEFLMLHLDEPMVRISDLRAEAVRQGRDVSFDDELTEDEMSEAPADGGQTSQL